MSDPGLLAAEDLQLRAGERLLFDRLDLRVVPGEFWCLLGPNGAGKSRLLEVLAGLRAAGAGSVRYQGRLFADVGVRRAACLRAFLPQQAHDAFPATVFEVACSGRHPWLRGGGWEDAGDRAQVTKALRCFGLDGLAARTVHSLSGGERQRLALATVLAQDTPLLLLDEPLNHLDLRQQLAVMEILGQAARERGRAVICAMHELSLAQSWATHVVLLDGRGGHLAGSAATVLDQDHLRHAFQAPLQALEAQGRRYWVVGTEAVRRDPA